MKLSIIIPSYNAQQHLAGCLDSIFKQYGDETEVIVVDCSKHEKVEEICSNYDEVKFIKVKNRFNPGEGRNIGAKSSVGEYLIFIDGDVVLDAFAIRNIIGHIDKGLKIFGAALELNVKANNSFTAHIEHHYFNHESQSTRKFKDRANLSSAFMVIEKSLFNEFGGFSDIARMQDTELTERIASQGYALRFAPDVIGYQIQDSPLSKVLNKIKITGNNLYNIRYRKNMNSLTVFLICLFLPLIMLAKITRINARNLRYSFSFKMLFIFVPFMYICGIYWMLGFYNAIIYKSDIHQGR
jgi:glycosyltransferase involved in cell wall biosynthesis